LGYAEIQTNTYDGKRYWSSNNYKFEKNVTTWTATIAEKLIIEEKRATAVQASRNQPDGTPERVAVVARKEILVASGVQGSAKLLLLRYAASDIQELLSLELTCRLVVLDQSMK
jgi:choline dehydrogenase-like flavoprotein